MKELCSVKTSGAAIPTIQCHNPEYLDFQTKKKPYSGVFEDYHGIYIVLLPKCKITMAMHVLQFFWIQFLSLSVIPFKFDFYML